MAHHRLHYSYVLLDLLFPAIFFGVVWCGKELCNINYYFDVNVQRCDHCSSICDMKELQNTQWECAHFCPEYSSETGLVKGESTKEDAMSTIILIAVLIPAVVVVVAAAILGFLKRQRIARIFKRPRENEPENVFVLQPLNRTSPGTEELTLGEPDLPHITIRRDDDHLDIADNDDLTAIHTHPQSNESNPEVLASPTRGDGVYRIDSTVVNRQYQTQVHHPQTDPECRDRVLNKHVLQPRAVDETRLKQTQATT